MIRHLLRLSTALAVGTAVIVPAGGAPNAEAQAGCRPPPVRAEPAVPWGQQLLAPNRVWDVTRGQGVTVAVVDTGVDATTPQLAGAVAPGQDTSAPGRGPGNTDCPGHGTFVAGIIAARPAAGTGFAGVAPGASILPIRDTFTERDGSPRSMARGIRAAADAGAGVINVSASTNHDDPDLRSAVDYARQHDSLVVAAAANNAERGNPIPYPAAYPGVLAVGAIDATGAVAAFSQTGGFVGMVAPGVDVVSLGPGGPGQWQQSGTSFATPFVSGAAALVRSYRPGLSATEVQDRLERTATRPGGPVPDAAAGWGTVNPYAAVTAALPDENAGSHGGAPRAPAPPPVPAADRSPATGVVLASVAGAVLLAGAAAIVATISTSGRKRGWRRRRITVVDSHTES